MTVVTEVVMTSFSKNTLTTDQLSGQLMQCLVVTLVTLKRIPKNKNKNTGEKKIKKKFQKIQIYFF